MADIIDIKPYITFIHGEYKFVEEDKFLDENPQLQRIMPYLQKRHDEEMEKICERIRENGFNFSS